MLYSSLKGNEEEEEEKRRQRAIEIIRQTNSGTYNNNTDISYNNSLNIDDDTSNDFGIGEEKESNDYETRRKKAIDIVNQINNSTGTKTYTAQSVNYLDGVLNNISNSTSSSLNIKQNDTSINYDNYDISKNENKSNTQPQKDTWFQVGAFDDGYQAGDIAMTVGRYAHGRIHKHR